MTGIFVADSVCALLGKQNRVQSADYRRSQNCGARFRRPSAGPKIEHTKHERRDEYTLPTKPNAKLTIVVPRDDEKRLCTTVDQEGHPKMRRDYALRSCPSSYARRHLLFATKFSLEILMGWAKVCSQMRRCLTSMPTIIFAACNGYSFT